MSVSNCIGDSCVTYNDFYCKIFISMVFLEISTWYFADECIILLTLLHKSGNLYASHVRDFRSHETEVCQYQYVEGNCQVSQNHLKVGNILFLRNKY